MICHPPERDLIVAGATRLVAPGDLPHVEAKRDEHDRPSVFVDGRWLSSHSTLDAARLVAQQHNSIRRAPQRWVDATGPCPTCGGTGWLMERWACPDCIDGRKREALRVACASPYCNGNGGDKDQPDRPCPNFCVGGSVRFAYATVEVRAITALHTCYGCSPVHFTVDLEGDRGVSLPFSHPTPVPGRDWVVLLDNVELT